MTTWSASFAVNHHQPRFRPDGMRQALPCLALLLLSGLGPPTTHARSRLHVDARIPGDWRGPDSAPYLFAIGAPGLRFVEPAPTPAPVLRPVAIGPPVPGLNAAETAVAVANAAAVRVTKATKAPTTADAKPAEAGASQGGLLPPASSKPVPSAILPDDTRPRVRAEDFLPFFQIPSTVGPALLPPSSATYTQTPR